MTSPRPWRARRRTKRSPSFASVAAHELSRARGSDICDACVIRWRAAWTGRRTFEVVGASGPGFGDKQVIVASRTLSAGDHPGVEVVRDGLESRVRELRSEPGRDIWLYGGGALLSQLLERDIVDTIEPAIIPILLGGGVPFLAVPSVRRRLKLTAQRVYPSGMVLLEYEVEKAVT